MGWAWLAAVRTEPSAIRNRTLSEPWRGYAQSAQDAKRRFDQIVASVADGPLRQRLADAVRASTRASTSRGGSPSAVTRSSRARADRHRRTQAELAELEARQPAATGAQAATIESLRAQLAAAERSSTLAAGSRDRLGLLDARFDELIARAVEVSVGSGDSRCSARTSTSSCRSWSRCASRWRRPTSCPACRRRPARHRPRVAASGEVTGPRPEARGERSALSRSALEDLGDYLDHHREVVAVPESRRPPASSAAARARPLLRSNLVVASGTALSRITGLLRVMVFGYVIGKGALADAYLIGNETPNIVYDLLIGGRAVGHARPAVHRVPPRTRRRGTATNVVITVSLTAMAVLTVVAVVAAPLIFGLYTVNTQDGVDPDLIQRVGTLLTGSSSCRSSSTAPPASPTPSSMPAGGSSPRRGVRCSPTSSSSSRCCRSPAPATELGARRRRGRRAPALDARPRRRRSASP